MHLSDPRPTRSCLPLPVRLMAALLLAACKGTEPPHAESLALLASPPAAAQSGVPLATSPVVEVRDGSGAPFGQAGITVTASVVGTGAILGGTTTRTTDGTGHATFSDLVIAGPVGTYTLRFSANGLAAATSTSVTLTAGPAAQVASASVAAFQATVGTAASALPAVKVIDATGNVVAGATVTFATSAGGGTLTGATQTTNATGIATLGGWTLPTVPGQFTVTATVAGTAGSPVSFVATTVPDAPAAMQPSGGGQAVLYGSRLPTPLQVRVVDQYGNPTPGVIVTWGSFTGAGTPEPINVATDADGVVRANYRLGRVPGQNIIRASVTTRGLSTDISATALAFSDQIAVDNDHSCAIDESGAAYCWGRNLYGQVGDGTTTDRNVPTPVAGGLRFQRITAGQGTTCALTLDGAAYCWGYNGLATVGDGTTTDRSVPTPVLGGLRFTALETSGFTTCGLTAAGSAYCWGSNSAGTLGVVTAPIAACTSPTANPFPCSMAPIAVSGGHVFSSISVATIHACGLTAAGELWCWGESSSWQPPMGGTQATPVRVASTMTFAKVMLAGSRQCGIVAPAAVYCWGSANFGALGLGALDDSRSAPTLMAGLTPQMLDVGDFGSCAVLADGRGLCWGGNLGGAVGDGTTTDRAVPTQVVTGESFTTIATSGVHACGRIVNGQVLCWGTNSSGEVGFGFSDFNNYKVPLPVLARP